MSENTLWRFLQLMAAAILIFKCTEGRGSAIIALGGGGAKNRETVSTSLRLAFTERVVPATQASDWLVDNRC